ncbi:GCRV induced gene 2i protein [Labeo rohita]|uniref:GCRV induced gene 2i protein n=1 Tax=Labeo rohita TaxID=84645 RepID=A0A498N493_LABRO|nr:GCRV induced gene 2i protein [Labeo rohita]
MWEEEDDLGPGAPPCLESYSGPEDGKVYRMYHGTSRENAEKIQVSGFKQSSDGMLGRGVYLSRDLEKASRYPLNLSVNEKVIVRVSVNVGRVKKIDRQGHPLQKTWHDHRTTARAAEQIKIHGFQPSPDGLLGRGVYLSRDLNKASRYPLDKPREREVIRVIIDVIHPI